MNVLGLIPARGGSKGIPRKNIAPVLGRPLLAYTCDAALASRSLTRVILSTDDEEIARVGREAGVEVPFLRPAHLSEDQTPSIDVVIHAVEWLDANTGSRPDAVVLLQPTSPLRTSRHIDEACDLLQADDTADSVVSVIEVPHRFNPYSIMTVRDGRLAPYIPDPVPFDRYRRQNLPSFVARNGPAVLVTKTDVIANRRSFYGDRILPYAMSELDSLDVDTEVDLLFVAAALEHRARSASQPAATVPGSR